MTLLLFSDGIESHFDRRKSFFRVPGSCLGPSSYMCSETDSWSSCSCRCWKTWSPSLSSALPPYTAVSVVLLHDLHVFQAEFEASASSVESDLLVWDFHTAKMLPWFADLFFLRQALHEFAFGATIVWLFPGFPETIDVSIMRDTFETNFQVMDQSIPVFSFPLLWEFQVQIIHVITQVSRLGDSLQQVSSHGPWLPDFVLQDLLHSCSQLFQPLFLLLILLDFLLPE
uniref:Uncharacterized protein n=1 Tax=Molossus molossus TaxID=27622 RepID=A0A7J8FSQ0_MOLMO|nr:hypothetical protein HJG59_008333 [Molossus molossus]